MSAEPIPTPSTQLELPFAKFLVQKQIASNRLLVSAHLTRRHEKGSRIEATHQGPSRKEPIAGITGPFGWAEPRAFNAEPPLVEEASGRRVAFSVLVHG